MNEQPQKPFKIYRDGQLDKVATYVPVLKRNLLDFGRKIDYLFVNNKWPSDIANSD